MKGLVAALAFSLLAAVPAFAEWGLHVNRDGKSWTLQEKTYESSSACDRAAQSLWAARGLYGSIHGVGCSALTQLTEAQKAAIARARSRQGC